ncbi:DUF6402 family protein [Aquimarina algiphila]|uniref:DUF6402 family protein n=1 Tax=Aquimarina algiphila TaxID=2047982 RepID=UPI00232CBA8E|nr:DUF6402 family protein [Aquimarina algiphila]
MVLDFEQDNVYVKFTPEEYVETKTYRVNVYAKNKSDGGNEKLVYTSPSYTFKSCEENSWHIVVDYMFYNAVAKKVATSGKPLPNIIDFSFKILIGEDEEEVPGMYSVHFVRYIPQILNILGWHKGENLQRIWFTKGSNTETNIVDPLLNEIKWDWAMSESSTAKADFKNFFVRTSSYLNDNYFLTKNKIRSSLKNEINKMIDQGLVTLPIKGGKNQPFGSSSSKIVSHNNEQIPEFEKFYFNSTTFDADPTSFDLTKHFLIDGFDDFVAALGSMNFHVFAIGELEYKEGFFSNSIKIKIKKIGFYIKDSFDFKREKEALGYWKIIDQKTMEVERSPIKVEEYYEIQNKSYRDYRDTHNKGYNFFLYSDVHFEKIDLAVTLKDL